MTQRPTSANSTSCRSAFRIALAAMTVIAGMLTGLPARAQDSGEPTIHWAFGPLLGTGVYRVSSGRTALQVEIPMRWTASRSAIGQAGERRIGIEVRAPITIGVLQGSSLGDYIDQDVYGTVTITPGVEVEIPVTHWWLLRPYVSVGWGSELGPNDTPDPDAPPGTPPDTNANALIYQTGLKSRFAIPSGIGNWGILAALRYAGYNPDVGASSDLLLASGGFETRQRLGSLMNGNHALFYEAHATYTYVTDLARLRNGSNPPVGVDDFVEVGLAVSQGVVPFRFLGIPIERLGLAFQMSTDTEFRAVKLSFRSPFRR